MTENLRQLLGDLVRSMMTASRAASGGAVVWDPGSGHRLLQFVEGATTEECGQRETCLTVREGKPVSPTSCSARVFGRPNSSPLLCVPLITNHEALGSVWLGSFQGSLTEGTRLGLASAMAQRAAVLLSNALAYRQLHHAALQAEQERLTRVMGRAVGTPAMATAATPVLDIRCLGTFSVLRHGQPVPPSAFSRLKSLAALKLLVSRRGHAVASEAIIEHLWPNAEPGVALNRLHGVVHSLRQAVEPAAGPPWQIVFTQGDGYILNTGVCRVDVDVFLSGFHKGKDLERQGRRPEALAAYLGAARVYHGDYLEDEPYTEWCLEEREHLRETYLDLLCRMAALLRAQGDREESIVLLRQALRVDPLREELHRQLMDCLHKAGRRDEALRQFETCRRVLKRELGVSPMPQTERLYRQVIQALSTPALPPPAHGPSHES